MGDAWLTPGAVALDAGLQWFLSSLASAGKGSKAKQLYNYPTAAAPVARVAVIDHARCRKADTIWWPDPGDKPVVMTSIVEDDPNPKRAAEPCAKRKEYLVVSGTCTWWMDGYRMDDGQVGAGGVSRKGEG